jgi:hypothetical protein
MFSAAVIPAKLLPRWPLVGLGSMLPSPFKYESLLEVEDPVTEIKISEATDLPKYVEQSFSRSRRRFMLYQTFCLFLGATVIVLLTWDIIKSSTGTTQAPSKAASHLRLNCSDNVEEAKALGCEFDLLSYSWTPAECFDRQTAAEFNEWVLSDERQLGAWPFFADIDTEQRISGEEALSQRVGIETRTSQEEHLGHCIFWMRRTERVQEGKVRLTARGDGLNHAIHCTASLLDRLKGPNPIDLGKAHAVFVVGFNTC